MDNFDSILNNASNYCEGMYVKDSIKYPFYLIYPFTTENIGGYIDLFNMENKSLLTVGSSLDQVLNAILYNASNVTVIDINQYVKFYYYLKLTSILSLSFNEYLDFLRYKNYPKTFIDNNKVLDINTFNRIKDKLRIFDYESYLFWDELIQKYGGKCIRTHLFSQDEEQNKVLFSVNPYMNSEKRYNELKSKILKCNVSFINGNVCEVKLDNKYDNIWLSNIGTYFDSREKSYNLKDKYNEYLNENGMLLLSYLYNTKEEYKDGWAPIYDLNSVRDETSDLDIEKIIGIKAPLFEDNSLEDSVLLYRKK